MARETILVIDDEQLIRRSIARKLETAGYQTRAAKLLGLNRDQIHYRIEKFKLATPARPEA